MSIVEMSVRKRNAKEQQAYDMGYQMGKHDAVQHGQWRLAKDGEFLIAECPQCGMVVDATQAAWWNYCPVCGLKTDAEGEDTWEADNG